MKSGRYADMGSYLNPGDFSFRGSLRSKIYVDKSKLIARTNEALCTEQKYICVSRPRRFGKSMAANMLAAYYDRSEHTEEFDTSHEGRVLLHEMSIYDFN